MPDLVTISKSDRVLIKKVALRSTTFSQLYICGKVFVTQGRITFKIIIRPDQKSNSSDILFLHCEDEGIFQSVRIHYCVNHHLKCNKL